MFKMFCVAVLSLTYGATAACTLAAPVVVAPHPAPPAAKAAAADPAPRLLRDIPQLQPQITLDVTDRPIGDVLAGLPPSLPAALSAARDVADQRVTLHLTAQPLYAVMDRLSRLLSHHADAPEGYSWSEDDRGARPTFRLWRDSHSLGEEQDALDYPQREIRVLLGDMRNMAGMSAQEEASYKGDCAYGMGDPSNDIYARAFQGLSDDQLDDLAAGQGVPLDPALYTAEIAVLHQPLINKETGTVTSYKVSPAITLGLPDPPSAQPMMYVTPVSDDNSLWVSPGCYVISLLGITDSMLELDTYDTNRSRSPDRLPLPRASGPIIDLTPLMTAPGVTQAQRDDVGFTLQALGRAAHINVYQEAFLQGNSSQLKSLDSVPGFAGQFLTPLKAPLPVLIAAVCAHWDYQWQKVGDDYLFWSRTWAQDRSTDVPERLLAPWQKRFQKAGYVSFDDRVEMAAALTYPQVSRTLAAVLPESGQWNHLSYSMLRFIGQLAPDQEQGALSDAGLPLAALAPWQQEALASGFQQQLQDVSDEQLSRAVLTLRVESVSGMYAERVILAGGADGTQLFGSRCLISFPHETRYASDQAAQPAAASGG